MILQSLTLTCGLLLVVCAGFPHRAFPPPAVPESLRSHLGVVEIVPEGVPPRIWFQYLSRGTTYKDRVSEGKRVGQRYISQGGEAAAGADIA